MSALATKQSITPNILATSIFKYEDYAKWPDNPRYELIRGSAIKMVAPTQYHQGMLMELGRQFANFLKGKVCKVFLAPFDVRLNHSTADNTVVQPDLVVVCDLAKLNGKHCLGAPDLVVEIVSPATARNDTVVKFALYREAGIKEYWIIEPLNRLLSVHLLRGSEYNTTYYSNVDVVNVEVLEGCRIDLADVFAEGPPELALL